MPALLNSREFAAALGVSLNTVRKWTCYDMVPVVRLGRTVRFKPETVEHIRANGLPSTKRPAPAAIPPAPATGWTRHIA